jgi:hypothetical protein
MDNNNNDNNDYDGDSDDEYPTYASAAPFVPSDDFFYLSSYDEGSFEEGRKQYLADEAERKAEVAARIQEEKPVAKPETAIECWKRITDDKHLKAVKSVKASAKKSVKAKKIYKITSHFKRF